MRRGNSRIILILVFVLTLAFVFMNPFGMFNNLFYQTGTLLEQIMPLIIELLVIIIIIKAIFK